MSGILGIENRTENWKTAVHFSPLFHGECGQFAEKLGAIPVPESGDVKIELFWKGMRDYFYRESLSRESFSREDFVQRAVDLYDRNFSNLRQEVIAFQEFRDLKEDHYTSTSETANRLMNSLLGTEVDVVLETPKHLFIGEVKHESTFGADGKLVLVHQLMRQYVTATILLQLSGENKAVIPFVVGDRVEYLKKTSQVRFMINQGWLKETNVLDWEQVK